MKEEQGRNRMYLPPRVDFVFKLLFGREDSKEILSGLIKAILKLEDEEFESLTLMNPYLLAEYEKDKSGILDIKVKTKSGYHLNIEMQASTSDVIKERLEFYNAKMVISQIERSEDYSVIKRTITILISTETVFPESPSYHHYFERYDIKNKVKFGGISEIHTLELSKLPQVQDNSMLWNWMYFIAAEEEEEFEMIAKKNETINKAVMELAVLSQDEKNRMLFEAQEKARMDRLAETRYYQKRATEEGMAKGLEKGRLEAIITAMDSLGLTTGEALDAFKVSDDERPKFEELIRESGAAYNVHHKE